MNHYDKMRSMVDFDDIRNSVDVCLKIFLFNKKHYDKIKYKLPRRAKTLLWCTAEAGEICR